MDLGFDEDFFYDNIKLGLMVVACTFAMVAQFYPMPFPESRPLLGVCCISYFLASTVIQLIVSYLEQDAILTTQPHEVGRHGTAWSGRLSVCLPGWLAVQPYGRSHAREPERAWVGTEVIPPPFPRSTSQNGRHYTTAGQGRPARAHAVPALPGRVHGDPRGGGAQGPAHRHGCVGAWTHIDI